MEVGELFTVSVFAIHLSIDLQITGIHLEPWHAQVMLQPRRT